MVCIDTSPGLNPRRNHDGGHPDTEPIEPEVEGRWSDNAVGAGDAVDRSGYVVVKPAVLVVGDDEEELVPLGAGPQGLVHLFHKLLALGDVVGRVVVIAG